MLRSITATSAVLLPALCIPLAASASLGPFEHGSGIKAMGAGGVSYVAAQETTALAANPAHASALGRRYDVGLDLMLIRPDSRIEGNALAPDESYFSDGRRWYPIPQAGFAMPLNERWAVGVTMLQAGLGPDYTRSPYARFGGGERANLTLGSASLASALAWRPVKEHSFGVGLVLGYEFLKVTGLEFLSSSDPQTQVSVAPDRVSNQGKGDALSIGFTVGWTGQLTPQLSAGAGYRSKAWTQKLEAYRGLLPDGGSLELPAVFGLGFAWQPQEAWTIALEWQHFAYGAEKAFGNPISRLAEGHLLGSPDGPGFGLRDQDAYKLGVSWKAHRDLELRAGYLRANQSIRRSDTLFTLQAPVTLSTHFTAGLTWLLNSWELSTALTYCPRQSVDGRGSIPEAFGGGEAKVSNQFSSLGISLGRRF